MRHLPHRGRPRGGKEPVADWSGAARPASQRRSLDSNPSLLPPTPATPAPPEPQRRVQERNHVNGEGSVLENVSPPAGDIFSGTLSREMPPMIPHRVSPQRVLSSYKAGPRTFSSSPFLLSPCCRECLRAPGSPAAAAPNLSISFTPFRRRKHVAQ